MASSLSPLQISQLRDSWSVLAQNPTQLASALVIRLFKENPEYQSLFKRLKNLPMDELASNPQFMSHASKVGAALGSTIDHLDKPEELEKILTNLGIKHKKYGLTPKHFQVIGNVLVAMIAEAIGDTDPELLDLWKSSLTSVLSIVIAACN
ncbi:neuroglobin-like [Rhopalosiphum maidis]|uniref:neuroglobin-like n=1 Tax=Rhopalosiphum maidis TaxID=43146 RepID=UPI000EFEFD2C|nr:neuroglobin-like [Rhopalosiphum maidis]XP_060835002.1 neuroglobin-like [Rhopalosiphum padi]